VGFGPVLEFESLATIVFRITSYNFSPSMGEGEGDEDYINHQPLSTES